MLRHVFTISADTLFSDLIVELQKGTGTPPIWLMHPMQGSVSCYAPLVSLFGAEQTFFGIRARGLLEDRAPATSVEEMAGDYLRAIQSIQPRGPYYLGGWSLGALIALETAKRLAAVGEAVASVASIEHSFEAHRPPFEARQNFLNHPNFLFLTFLLHGRLTIEFFLKYQQIENGDEQLEFLVREGMRQQLFPPSFDRDAPLRLVRLQKANFDAGANYQPDPAGMPVVYFLGSDFVPIFGREGPQDYLRGARPRANLKIIHGANHLNILNRPFVEKLAQVYKAYLASNPRGTAK